MIITCTRAEIEDVDVTWRWFLWCRSWALIGALLVEVDRAERALWSSWSP